MTSFHTPSVHPCPGCDAFFLRRRFRSVNFFGVQDWSDGKPTWTWRQEPLVRCGACAALFWLDDIEPVGIMPQMPRPMGRFTRIWLRWRGDPQGRLQDQEEWTEAISSWGHAQYVDRVNFDDVVYVFGAIQKREQGSAAVAEEAHLVGLERPLPDQIRWLSLA